MSQNDQEIITNTSPQVEFLAGLGSAFLTITITYPIAKLIYRQILENQNAAKSFKTIRKEGTKVLYRGSLAPMLQRCIALSTMFGVYRAASIPLESFQMNEYLEKISACILSGSFESIFMPLERIQMLLVSSSYHNRFRNMFHAVKVIAKEYNFQEFYRGYTVILFRNISSNSCFFITKDEINKRFELSDIAFKRSVQHFIFGSIVGSFMTVLFYPVKVIKVNIHKQLGGKFRTVNEVVKEIYVKNGGGVCNFYRGIVINCGRALFSWGITNSSYEYIKRQLS